MKAGVIAVIVAVAVALLGCCHVCLADVDYYEVLGVARDANARTIKKAYRKLSLKYHPDKQAEPSQTTQDMFVKVADAYAVLSDPEKRQTYDRFGHDGLKKAEGRQQGGGHDPFANFFRRGRQQQASTRAPDLRVPLRVTLEQLYNGSTQSFRTRTKVVCTHCHGTGADDPSTVKKCPHCGGSGHIMERRQVGRGFFQQIQRPCNHCHGTGETRGDTCHVCGGRKVAAGNSEHEVIIERGMPDGHEIRFDHAADAEPDKAPGHLVLVVTTMPHPTFTRNGNDLEMTHSITLSEALVGFRHTLTHLDGHSFTLARSGVTKPGLRVTVPREGMPLHNFPSDKGHLRVTLNVVFPTKLSKQQEGDVRALFHKHRR